MEPGVDIEPGLDIDLDRKILPESDISKLKSSSGSNKKNRTRFRNRVRPLVRSELTIGCG